MNQQHKNELEYSTQFFTFLIILHSMIVYLGRLNPNFATMHALGTVVIGLIWSLRGDRVRFIYLTSYVAGSEMFWRMSHAKIFWESGKYFTCFIILCCLFFKSNYKQNYNLKFIIYFILLIPSLLILDTINRETISFYMSGPISLALCGYFFSSFYINNTQLKNCLFSLFLPLAGMLLSLVYSTYTSEILFTAAGSMGRVVTGGIGPNQMSSALGLGALISFLLSCMIGKNQILKLSLYFFMILF